MNDVAAWVVIVAAAPGVVALAVCLALWLRVRRLRAAQRVLLPDGTPAGVVDRQASLQRETNALAEAVAALRDLVGAQAGVTQAGLRTALRFQGLVRYDAYRDMGGQQSWSIALLDGERNGAVVTSLHARDHARVYLKELVAGAPGQRLSPEEQRAVTLATGEPPPPAPAPATAPTEAPAPAEDGGPAPPHAP